MNNKKYLLSFSVALLIIFLVVYYNSFFTRRTQYTQCNKICNVSINDIKIDDKATDKMKNGVLDADFAYEYNNVGFSVDDNDIITSMRLLTYTSADKNYSIEDAEVMYNNVKLTKIEDFESFFGKGEEKIDEYNSSYKIITYSEGKYKLEVSIHNDKVNSVSILNTNKK